MAPKLTTASHIVLGLVEFAQPASPYELKELAARSVASFWALPHTQIYAQVDRLLDAGLISEKREETGRRRRELSITPAGRKALDKWRAEQPAEHYELRDESVLKIFFGADPLAIAEQQIPQHEERLRYYESVEEIADQLTEGQRLALEIGLGHEREYLRFWKQLIKRNGAA